MTAADPIGLTNDELLTTTRSVRKRLDFDKPVSRDVLMECLDIALQAPTGSNSQGWQWVFVTDPDKKLALAEIYRTNATPYLNAEKPTYGDERDERAPAVASDGYICVPTRAMTGPHASIAEALRCGPDTMKDGAFRLPVDCG